MESIGTEALNLICLAGLPVLEERPSGDGGTIAIYLPDCRDVRARMEGPGTIEIAVPEGQCLAVVEIAAFNEDLTLTNTVTVGTQSSPGMVQRLEYLLDRPCLYVFGAGITAQFVFDFAGVATALAEVRGYFLPVEGLKRLKRIATSVF